MANDTTPSVKGQDGRNYENIDTNKTLTLADCGIVQNVIATGVILTLPSTSAGAVFRIRNGGTKIANGPSGANAGGGVTLQVSPASVDKIQGLGFTAADNKDAINTSGRIGDELTLVGDGVDGWLVFSSA